MDRIELKGKALAIAAELSALRSEQWTAVDGSNYWNVCIVGPNDAALYFEEGRRTRDDGAFHIGGSFHGTPGTRLDYHRHRKPVYNGNYSSHPNHSINVSQAKGPLAIAKDINRRLLPDYLAELAEAKQRKAEAEAYEVGKAALLDELKNFGLGSLSYLDTGGSGYGSVEVNGPDSVEIKLRSLPADKARQVLALVKCWRVSETGTAAGGEEK